MRFFEIDRSPLGHEEDQSARWFGSGLTRASGQPGHELVRNPGKTVSGVAFLEQGAF
jgi:hypothetical protein